MAGPSPTPTLPLPTVTVIVTQPPTPTPSASDIARATSGIDWSFPFWSIVVGAVVTGLVTWVTITISVREARKATERTLAAQHAETDRVLAEQRVGERAAAINDLVAVMEESETRPVTWGSVDARIATQRQLAVARIAACGAPYAAEVAEWAFLLHMLYTTLSDEWPDDPTVDMQASTRYLATTHPSELASIRLTWWHEDPAKEGPRIVREAAMFDAWLDDQVAADARRVEVESVIESEGPRPFPRPLSEPDDSSPL